MENYKMIKTNSTINYSYSTIQMTKSRIDKGLLAIPRALERWFPSQNANVQIYFDNSDILLNRHYSSYKSSTRESRIGGMAEWFEQNKLKEGDEIVIQVIDKDNYIYRITQNQKFIAKTQELQDKLDNSESELAAANEIINISQWISVDKKNVVLNEYYRLVNTVPMEKRLYIDKPANVKRENVSYNIKMLLGEMYKGHCQVCDFTFLKKDKNPYYEIHHIEPSYSNHPKNLILLCANCHRQFEYAQVGRYLNDDGWLIEVIFNNKHYYVNQILLKTKMGDFIKRVYV